MPSISRLYDFQAGTTIQSSQVDDEFNQLISTINALPDVDGTIQTNLNSDLLDGFHANNAGGTNNIPVCVAGTIQINLNADLLDGQHAADIAAAAFDQGTRLLAYQASPPGGWSEIAKPTDHIIGWRSGQAGGTQAANSWTVSGITVNVATESLTIADLPAHTHSLNSHTHDISHSHGQDPPLLSYVVSLSAGDTLTIGAGSGYGTVTSFDSDTMSTTTSSSAVGNTGSTGSNSGHNHPGSTASQNGTWRPPTAFIIVIEKD